MAESSWWDDIADWWSSEELDAGEIVEADTIDDVLDIDLESEAFEADTSLYPEEESTSLSSILDDSDDSMFTTDDVEDTILDDDIDVEVDDTEDFKLGEDEDGEESAILGAAKGVIKNKTVQKYLADLVTGSLASRQKDKDRKNALADAMALATHKASLSKSSGGSGETPAATTTPGRVGAVTRK